MNTACKTLVSAAVLSLLSACATTDTARHDPGPTIKENTAYIVAVDDIAQHESVRVDVIWVNPPTKREDY